MTSQLNLDLSSLQQQVEDNLTCLRQLGRKSALAYLGLWGMIYDNTKALVNDNAAWIDLVEKRGIQLEAALGEKVQQLDNQAAHELKKWREQAKENRQQVAPVVADAVDQTQSEIEQRIEQILARLGIPNRDRLEKLSREIDALSQKIDQQLVRTTQATPAQPAAALPIAGYAEMNAKTAINQLKGLTVEQLAAMRAYEAAHAGRVTVLREIDQQVKRALAVE